MFSTAEVRDLTIAWGALGVAFTAFIGGPGIVGEPAAAIRLFGVCLATAGIGFLLHELAHKVVALRLGRPATFRAEYGLLFLTVMSGLAGFLFAAPGAVYHRGPPDPRSTGLVAVAGPVTNLGLVVTFLPLFVAPWNLVAMVGAFGLWINALLAAFNMLPFGPLDGRTVLSWHRGVFLLVLVPSLAIAALTFVHVGVIPSV